MPPAKRRKVSQNCKDASTAPTNMKDVAKVCLVLRDWINELYAMRHGVPAEQQRAWPVECGGSFLDVVQRAFSQPDKLLEDSLEFCKRIGLISMSSSTDDFEKRFLFLKAWFCKGKKWSNNNKLRDNSINYLVFVRSKFIT